MNKTIRVRDDRGRTLSWTAPPSRVVSLVPSDTYSLVKLGLGDRLVGRTTYCIEPAADVADIPAVGGTKDADVESILALKPDLVVANQEENTRPMIERLEAAGASVLVSFPKTVAQGVAHLARLAIAVAVEEQARELIRWAYRSLERAERESSAKAAVPAFVAIWMDPLMTVNEHTFISDVLRVCGASNVFADRDRKYPLAADIGRAEPLTPDRVGGRDTRYPRVTLEEVAARAPEIVLLPDEPHPFTEEDARTFRGLDIPAARKGKVLLCDGKDLMWPGARSLEGLERLTATIDTAR